MATDRTIRLTMAAHAGRQVERYSLGTWWFLRGLGLVYLVAFWSLHQQGPGLIGPEGILPAGDYLTELAASADASGVGAERYRLVPTLLWFSSEDAMLRGLTTVGIVLSVLLAAGVAPALVLPPLWVGYLSLTVGARDFLSFQWDGLLLEAGLLAMLVCPLRWRHRRADWHDPSPVGRWLIWWLVMRLMFGSGLAKLASDDPSWATFTAVAVHYETQPLPTPLAWFAAQLPLWFHRLSTALVLVVELVVPWGIVAGARPRRVAAAGLIALQLLIALTGNFAFFNLLSVALCFTLLDDRLLAGIRGIGVPEGAREPATAGGRLDPTTPPSRAVPLRRHLVPLLGAVVIVPVSLLAFSRQPRAAAPEPLQHLAEFVRPFRSINSYGLFAVMTTTRREIVIEGSMDGTTWRAYEFRHKPVDVSKRPAWVAPFQPRLDWQMWFAALGPSDGEPWFWWFARRLLEGSQPVRGLLATDPFRGARPRFVRATLYRYRFSRWGSPDWWIRERLGEYLPPMSLDDAGASGGALPPAHILPNTSRNDARCSSLPSMSSSAPRGSTVSDVSGAMSSSPC